MSKKSRNLWRFIDIWKRNPDIFTQKGMKIPFKGAWMRLWNVGMDGDGRIRAQKSPNQPQNPNINPKKTLGVGFFLPEFFQGSKKIPFPPPKSLPVDLGSFPRLIPNPGDAAGPAPLPMVWWERRKIWGFWGFHPKIPGVDPKGFPRFFWGEFQPFGS